MLINSIWNASKTCVAVASAILPVELVPLVIISMHQEQIDRFEVNQRKLTIH